MKTYPVLEIFSSIQGEGCMIGMAVTFIRFSGCNLECPWCDTKHSWKEAGTEMSLSAIVEQVDQNIVVLTGGEPCLQDLEPLIEALKTTNPNVVVCLETNATLPTPPSIDWVVASPKPPEYRIHGECYFHELKYVVDENFTPECVPVDEQVNAGNVWLQPESGNMEAAWKRCYELTMAEPHRFRVGVQLHKLMGVE